MNYKIVGFIIILILVLSAFFPVIGMMNVPNESDIIPVKRLLRTDIWTTNEFNVPDKHFLIDDIVYIYGKDFFGNHNLYLDIIRPDNNVDSILLSTDFSGCFNYIYDSNQIIGNYNIYCSRSVLRSILLSK